MEIKRWHNGNVVPVRFLGRMIIRLIDPKNYATIIGIQ